MDTGEMNAALFADHLNTKFKVQTDGSSAVELELIDVHEYDFRPGQEAFSLIFRGPLDPILDQAIRHIEHPSIGGDIFLVPIAKKDDGMHYEAAFNRFHK